MSSPNWTFEPPSELPKKGRTCPKCGWYYPPSSYALKECMWCKTPLEVQVCKYCGRPISIDEAYRIDTNYISRICSLCEKQIYSIQRRVNNTTSFNKRINRIRRLNEEYDKFIQVYKTKVAKGTLTVGETNSITDRRHIGCAFCHKEIINHVMLIPPKLGGLYEPCNVIPVCEYHNKILEFDYNPLISTDYYMNKDSTEKVHNEMIKLLTKKERWLDAQYY